MHINIYKCKSLKLKDLDSPLAAICQDDSRNPSSLSDDEESVTMQTEEQTDSELMLSSFIFMLDITLKQVYIITF